MKKLGFGIVAAALSLLGANSAWALSVSLDVPVAYEFDQGGSAESVSGFKAGVGLPLLPLVGVGIGYENYEAKLKDQGVTSAATFEIFDLFLELPFPIVNLSIGAGWGRQKVEIDSLGVSEEGGVSQLFASVGFPILPLIDVHVGYHDVSAEELKTAVALPPKVDASGQMWSLGVRVGF